MARVSGLWRRYRIPALALVISATLHAAVMVGIPGRSVVVDDSAWPEYLATLDPAAPPAAAIEPAARPAPKPRRSMPRRARPEAAHVVAMASEALDSALPTEDYAPEAPSSEELAQAALPQEPAAPPPQEQLAMAQPATPVPALEAPKFSVSALPARLSVTYALTSAFADGRAVYDWRRDGDRYRITSEAEAIGFFTLFLEGRIRQESEGSVTAEGLRPERFVEHRPNADDEGLEFDWTADRIILEHGGEKHVAPLSANSVDWLSMIFQLAAAPPTGETFDLQVYTQRKLYKFRLRSLGIEEIDVPIGRLRARHLQHVDNEKGEVVDVWVGIDQHNLPVKLRFPVARNRLMVEQVVTDISER